MVKTQMHLGIFSSSSKSDIKPIIPTAQNPAGCVTRGMSAANLIKSDAWWRGPKFLRQGEEKWPASKSFEKPTGDVELKRCATIKAPNQPAHMCSLIRVFASRLNIP